MRGRMKNNFYERKREWITFTRERENKRENKNEYTVTFEKRTSKKEFDDDDVSQRNNTSLLFINDNGDGNHHSRWWLWMKSSDASASVVHSQFYTHLCSTFKAKVEIHASASEKHDDMKIN